MYPPRVLVVEDEVPPDLTLRQTAPRGRFRFDWSAASARPPSQAKRPAVVLLHSGAESSSNAFRALDRVGALGRDAPHVFVTTHGSERMAAAALRHGFDDYFSHPLGDGEPWSSLLRLAEDVAGRNASRRFPRRPSAIDMVGPGAAFGDVRRQIELAASCSSNVLITGESGVGKELVARKVHGDSARRARPFLSINLAAMPDTLLESELFGHERGAFTGADSRREGKFRQADGGVLFLDEIGDMSLQAQAKILRAIENREVCPLGGARPESVDFRLVAATNRDLEAAVRAGTFRLDLYHRLNVIRLDIPPLRDRREDIPALVEHFVAAFNRTFGLEVSRVDPGLMDLLIGGEWPGNVRELSNVIEAAFVNRPESVLEASRLPRRILADLSAGRGDGDKERLVRALVASGGNKSAAARKLNWSRMTLYRKMSRYRISSEVTKRQSGAAA